MVYALLVSLALAEPEMIPLEVFQAAKEAKPSGEAADFEIELRDGGTFRMAEQRGKKVLLTFWASWCGPCRQELPALTEWAKAHSDVVVLAVSVDREKREAERFIQAVHFDLPVAFDPDAQHFGKYGVTSMPTMFLFDSAGELAWQHTGYGKEKGFTELDAALGGAK